MNNDMMELQRVQAHLVVQWDVSLGTSRLMLPLSKTNAKIGYKKNNNNNKLSGTLCFVCLYFLCSAVCLGSMGAGFNGLNSCAAVPKNKKIIIYSIQH